MPRVFELLNEFSKDDNVHFANQRNAAQSQIDSGKRAMVLAKNNKMLAVSKSLIGTKNKKD